MDFKQKFTEYFKKQQTLLNEYEKLMSDFEQNDFVVENQELKSEVENYKKQVDETNAKLQYIVCRC
jgi:hypothetical protein